jgi:hypothetical protein
MHEETTEPIQNAAQVIERAAQVDVGNVDMPVLMRLQRAESLVRAADFPSTWKLETLGGLLRVVPPHPINLSHASIAHRRDVAILRDREEVLRSIHDWTQARKVCVQLPLALWYG